jgi:hypothetical protein
MTILLLLKVSLLECQTAAGLKITNQEKHLIDCCSLLAWLTYESFLVFRPTNPWNVLDPSVPLST